MSRVWTHIGLAATAMVATLPGRTHGLGLVTEPLMSDLDLGRVEFASMNLWATLIGAAFCVPYGWLSDRLGLRITLPITLAGLGGVVMVMGNLAAGAPMTLFALLLLTRALGQSALSVGSLALMGRSLGSRPGWKVGVYSILVAVGFMAAFGLIKVLFEVAELDWRTVWIGIGAVVLGLAPVFWLMIHAGTSNATGAKATPLEGMSLGSALGSPAFWVFALGTSLYGLIASGVSLFNQSILEERGFSRETFLTITVLAPVVGLAGNLATGWASGFWPMGRLLAIALGSLAAALLAFPLIVTLWQVYAYAVVMGLAGGMVTVIFFGFWRKAFGTRALGQIQGAAQMITVLASACGPLVMAISKEQTGSFNSRPWLRCSLVSPRGPSPGLSLSP